MPATLDEIQRLLEDVVARAESAPAPMSEDQIRSIANDLLTMRLSDPDDEVYRKLRFSGGDKRLIGTKFSRWGLTTSDIEMLYDIMCSNARGGGRGPSAELTAAFQAVSDAIYMTEDEVRAIDRTAIDNAFPRVTKANRAQYESAMRAMDSAESGYGAQLIGAQYVGQLWEAARPMQRIFPLFNSFEMTAPVAYLPVEAGLPPMLFVPENTAYNSAEYATSKTGSNRITVTAYKFLIHQMWSGELEEDSIIPWLPFLRRQATMSLAYYSDALLLNGDTTNAATGNINEDNADPADTNYYLAFDGLRHAGLVDNTGNRQDVAGAITFDHFVTARSRMAQAAFAPMHWGLPTDPNDLVYIMDPATYFSILKLDEFVTVDKYGPGATVLTGEVGRIGGHPVIVSQTMKLTAADGKVDTADDGTKGQVVTCNRNGSVVGWRRRIMVETERLPARDQTRIVYSMRLGFGQYSPTGVRSGIEHCDVMYNITV